MKTCCIYPNLSAEMARRKITMSQLAEELGIKRETLSRNLTGRTQIRLDFAMRIHRDYFAEIPFEVLFATENKQKAAPAVEGAEQPEEFVPCDSNGINLGSGVSRTRSG